MVMLHLGAAQTVRHASDPNRGRHVMILNAF
jgi:hypothetical protein